MTRYRKKPVVVEAVQTAITPVGDMHATEWPEWFMLAIADYTVYQNNDAWYIKTLDGDHRINDGDFIIRGVKGELYLCKPDIFGQTYEAVDHVEH